MNRLPILAAAVVALAVLGADLAQSGSGQADLPVKFIHGTVTGAGFTTAYPTAIAYGPDGRLYVADWAGRLQALTLDPDSKAVIDIELVASDAELQEVFGIAFDPTDTSSPPPIYVTNTLSGLFGAGPPGGYPGKVTKIYGAGYAIKSNIISGLPIGEHGHQSNGLAFRGDGTLYVAQGGTTNAGLPDWGSPRPEVPLSGALLVANPSAPGFDGNLTYDPPDTYDTTVDQISGDVAAYAAGFRNPYDLVIHSNGRIYVTDNGPNLGDGPASTGCDSETTDPNALDELNLVEEGNYYGHPNRNRGRLDPRQCTYHSPEEGSGPDWSGPLAILPASSNGLVEYTVGTFGGKLQGNLFYVGWVDGVVGRIVLSPDGTAVVSHSIFDTGHDHPLDITMGDDGTLYIAEFGSSNIVFLKPEESGAPPVDTDGDGCKDKKELSLDPMLGGRRDRTNFWDFFDTPNPNANPQRDRAVTVADIFAVAAQFGHSCAAPP